jgi:MFS transporter, DHA2 family, multidrug resistance protein
MFMSKGMPPNTALQSAYKALDYIVSGQAAVLSYMDVFYYLGILFLICIPFVLFVKRSKQKTGLSEAMH